MAAVGRSGQDDSEWTGKGARSIGNDCRHRAGRSPQVARRGAHKAGRRRTRLVQIQGKARTAALDSFRKGEVALLIASDVAARGLDIPAVSHVFNFDVPHHADDYVHRIGRTGRAGRSGTAITVVSPADGKAVAAIEKLIGQSIPWMNGPPPAATTAEREAPGKQNSCTWQDTAPQEQ
jgi:superfamily II DNA/RNA helicase